MKKYGIIYIEIKDKKSSYQKNILFKKEIIHMYNIKIIPTSDPMFFEVSNEDLEILKSLENKKFIVEDGDEITLSFEKEVL